MEIIGPFNFEEYDAHQIHCINKKYHPSYDLQIIPQPMSRTATEQSTLQYQKSRREQLFDEQMHIWTNVERPHLILGIEKFFETRIRQPFHLMHIEKQIKYSTQDHSSVIGSVNGLVAYKKSAYVYRRATWGIFLADKPELEELKQEIILEWKFNQ